MFDLSKSLHDWEQQLRQGDGCSQDNIHELEEHLREEMAGLVRAGLSSEEAFSLAARRLGKVDALNEEFGKVNTGLVWRNRLRWMASGVLICLGASTAEAAFRSVLTAGLSTNGPDSVRGWSPDRTGKHRSHDAGCGFRHEGHLASKDRQPRHAPPCACGKVPSSFLRVSVVYSVASLRIGISSLSFPTCATGEREQTAYRVDLCTLSILIHSAASNCRLDVEGN